ncbi:helix-turn-helix transcriptional regulator [Alteribacter populi]|uniref:helix-turn-helix transcriptional regulator n=1 Tax=Alteribacter populi TaxID=2011011 RepID=UPI000BBA95F1|nr:helix-turn-helix transcriptional regulator [Alteribacter populi]
MNGKILKYHRLKQRKKQDEVCKGICSVSYYSKIENDQIDVSQDLMEQLMSRLEIHETGKSVHDENQLKSLIHQFNELVIDREVQKADNLSFQLHDQLQYSQNPHLLVFYEIVLARLNFLKNEFASAEVLIEKNEVFVKEIEESELRFHFLKMKSVYVYFNQDFQQSLKYLRQADEIRMTLHLPHKDVVDLYYMLGLTAYRVNDINLSMFYVNEAVKVYDSHYDYHRSGDCRLLLGLCYKGLKKYSEAEKQYDLAMKLAKNIQQVHLESKVMQAKGELYAAMDRSLEAIHLFQMSYRLRQGTKRLICVHSILEEFYKLGLYSELTSWIEHGFETLKENEKKSGNFLIMQYYYHFMFYKHIASQSDSDELEKVLKDEIVPFFDENFRDEYIYKYGRFLAEVYERKQHYRKSVGFYKKAMRALERLNHD